MSYSHRLTSDQGPIFIGGADRSGKTYMRMMLSSHPSIVLSRRTNMWTQYYSRFGSLEQERNLERCLEAMLHRKQIRFLQPDTDRIWREFQQGPKTYAHLFSLFHEHYAERQGKTRWGDQTELIECLADPILTSYPGARMIYMVRDPRDQYVASYRKRSRRKGWIGYVMARWIHSVETAFKNERQYPAQYLIVRYETMVTSPRETMKTVCHFLGESYFPEMISLKDEARFDAGTSQRQLAGESPLSTSHIGGYRKALTLNEIAFIQDVAGKHMRPLQYEEQPIAFTLAGGLFYHALFRTRGLAQLLAGRTVLAARLRTLSRKGSGRLQQQPSPVSTSQ